MIFGYTGLRLAEGGLEPAFPPVLPSHVSRLVLRNLHVRGKRYDVVVDSTGRQDPAARRRPSAPVIALALLVCCRRPSRRCSPFPSRAWTTPAAYQGYQTRFYRDSKGNTVQIYLEPRGGRVVNLWADAADESLGFTVRDAAGKPPRLDLGGRQRGGRRFRRRRARSSIGSRPSRRA